MTLVADTRRLTGHTKERQDEYLLISHQQSQFLAAGWRVKKLAIVLTQNQNQPLGKTSEFTTKTLAFEYLLAAR